MYQSLASYRTRREVVRTIRRMIGALILTAVLLTVCAVIAKPVRSEPVVNMVLTNTPI